VKKPMPRVKPGVPRKPAGRPTNYSQDVAVEFCERVITGRDLKDVCSDDDMPSYSSVYRWRLAHPEFDFQCARAREALADHEMHELKRLADACTEDNVNSTRVKLNHYQWRVMKIAPRIYGEVSRHEVSGPGGGPIELKPVTIDVDQLAVEDREALKRVLLMTQQQDGTYAAVDDDTDNN
jgi:hypothetical protein